MRYAICVWLSRVLSRYTHGKNDWITSNFFGVIIIKITRYYFLSVYQLGCVVVSWKRQANILYVTHTKETSNWDRIYLIKYHLWLSIRFSPSFADTFAHTYNYKWIHFYSIQSQKSDLIGVSLSLFSFAAPKKDDGKENTFAHIKIKKRRKWIKKIICYTTFTTINIFISLPLFFPMPFR